MELKAIAILTQLLHRWARSYYHRKSQLFAPPGQPPVPEHEAKKQQAGELLRQLGAAAEIARSISIRHD